MSLHIKQDTTEARKQLGIVERPNPNVISDEQFVMAHHPGAEIYGGGHGKVWVQDGAKYISEVCYLGTCEQRRAAAWKSAAEYVTRRKHLIEEICFVESGIRQASPGTPIFFILTRIKERLTKELQKHG